MEKPENNIFLKENLIEANAQIAPEIYEHVALYSALYQSIFGSYIDYGFTDRAAVDKYISAKIKTMLTVIDKIFKDPANKGKTFDDIMNNNFDPPPGLKSSDSHFLDENIAFQHIKENNWIRNYLPLLKKTKSITVFNEETGLEEEKKIEVIDHQRYDLKDKDGTVKKEGNYASNVLKNFDRIVNIAEDLSNRVGKDYTDGGMLNIKAARQLLRAKETEVRKLWEGWRAGTEGQPYKVDNEGKAKGGAFYREFMGMGTGSAIEQLADKNKLIRESRRKFSLKLVGTLAAGALTLGSISLVMPFIGITSFLGTTFLSAGIGNALVGAIGAIAGGGLFSMISGSLLKEFGTLREYLRDRKRFMIGAGAYKTADGKVKGFKDLAKRYYTALGLRQFFLCESDFKKDKNGNYIKDRRGRYIFTDEVLEKVDKKALKYVTPEFIMKNNLLKQKNFFRSVEDKKGTFYTMYTRLGNVVQGVPEQMEHRELFAGEATGMVRKVLENKSATFAELIDGVKVLTDNETKIGKLNTRNFQKGFAAAFDNAFSSYIYDRPYTSETLRLRDQLAVEQVKNMLTHSENGGAEKRIDANLTFLDTIKTPFLEIQRPLKLDTTLGVSIEQQVVLKRDVISNACKGLEPALTEGEQGEILSIAEKIENMTHQSQASSILTDISHLSGGASSKKIKNYLTKILEKKRLTARISEVEIKNAIMNESADSMVVDEAKFAKIVRAISTLKRGSKGEFVSDSGKTFEAIRAEIMSSQVGLSEDRRKKAFEMLDNQIRTIENQELLEVEATTIPSMKEGNFTPIVDLMKQINELTFADIASDKVTTLYFNKIIRSSFRKFLEVQLKTKIESIIISEADERKYSTQTENTLNDIVNFIQSVNACKILDSAQRSRIIASMQDKIEKAVNLKINKVKEDFALNYNNEELLKLINPETGTLREFFALKTPKTEALRKKISDLTKLSQLKTNITASIIGVGTELSEDPKEANAFSTIYMFNGDGVNRQNNDTLLSYITDIAQCARNVDINTFNVSDRKDSEARKSNNFIKTMRNFAASIISDIKNAETSSDPQERVRILRDAYASLIVLKKNSMAMFKAHVNAFNSKIIVPKHSGNVSEFFNKDENTTMFMRQVYDSWVYDESITRDPNGLLDVIANFDNKGILNIIDDTLQYVTSQLSKEEQLRTEEYTYQSAVLSSKKSFGKTTASQYMSSQSL